MPVVITPQPDKVGRIDTWRACSTAKDLLAHHDTRNEILRHSFEKSQDRMKQIIPEINGFVETVLHAFQHDMHLELRPDNVWHAIMSQFSFYINAHSEELRLVFVNHSGQKHLKLDITPYTIWDADVGHVSSRMAGLVKQNLADPDLADWLLPEFSTTLESDRVITAMMLLGAMKKYFRYTMVSGCGFPSVTLHGDREDWVDLTARAKRFAYGFGTEAEAWSVPLVRVLEMMVTSFDRPDTDEIRDFWMSACHVDKAKGSGRGGYHRLSGWLTIFCWWDEKGKRVREFEELQGYEIRGARCPVIARIEIPTAITKVPVIWNNMTTGEVHSTEILAGLVGMKLLNEEGSSAQPASGWWVLENGDTNTQPT